MTDTAKKALIVFPSEWIKYSPTVLNTITCLSEKYEVDVIAFDNGDFSTDIQIPRLNIVKVNNWLFKILIKTRTCAFYKIMMLIHRISKMRHRDYQVVIGIDPIGFVAARIFYPKTVFLSLEFDNLYIFKLCSYMGIHHLIIQSEERKNYLLGDADINVSYIQNAPIFNYNCYSEIKSSNLDRKKNLIYFGNIGKLYCVEQCIDALRLLDEAYTLTLKGPVPADYQGYLAAKYADLLSDGRLTIDSSYIDQAIIMKYLADYYIGFCFYDMDFISKKDYINYVTCPSGKLFNYYLAGVPVIGLNIVGLKSIGQFHAGILLDKVEGKTIAEGVTQIEGTYGEYSANAFHAGKSFDFKKAFEAFYDRIASA